MARQFLRNALGIWAAISVLGAPAAAQDAPRLRLAHYSTGNGLAGFVLDRQALPVKLRFDGSDEILALMPERSLTGGTGLKRDDGTTLLRLGDNGSVTLFTATERDGVRTFIDQEAQTLTLPPATKWSAAEAADRARARVKTASGLDLPIAFDAALEDRSANWSNLADAAMIVGVALSEVTASTLGREAVAGGIERVLIRAGAQPDIALEGKTLVIAVVADRPVAGRPSSALIKAKLGDLL
jgi:hypothetical protein